MRDVLSSLTFLAPYLAVYGAIRVEQNMDYYAFVNLSRFLDTRNSLDAYHWHELTKGCPSMMSFISPHFDPLSTPLARYSCFTIVSQPIL